MLKITKHFRVHNTLEQPIVARRSSKSPHKFHFYNRYWLINQSLCLFSIRRMKYMNFLLLCAELLANTIFECLNKINLLFSFFCCSTRSNRRDREEEWTRRHSEYDWQIYWLFRSTQIKKCSEETHSSKSEPRPKISCRRRETQKCAINFYQLYVKSFQREIYSRFVCVYAGLSLINSLIETLVARSSFAVHNEHVILYVRYTNFPSFVDQRNGFFHRSRLGLREFGICLRAHSVLIWK